MYGYYSDALIEENQLEKNKENEMDTEMKP